ncbi:alpha/beta fold hydrolase [Niveispirillum fermenti]|uniref:alpha/beta fold hydrolase n=1 Tax=Niveispirillum fermenti TaxID=1233113 RepID=UPI003A858CEC
MTGPLLLFVHGWAGTPRLWDPVRAALSARGVDCADMACVDLNGLYGTLPAGGIRWDGQGDHEGRPVIGIGHSLGSALLLAHGPVLAGFVALNGFTRFTSAPDFPAGTPPRVLAQMRRRLLANAPAVLADFHARAGLPPPAGLPGADVLASGLDLLGGIDARTALAALDVPWVALGGADDAIVPPDQSRASFPAVLLVPGGGHALPVLQPDLCAAHILSVAARC